MNYYKSEAWVDVLMECTACQVLKPSLAFNDDTFEGGEQPVICKVCQSKRHKEYKKRNGVKIKALSKAYLSDPTNYARQLETTRAWQRKNKTRMTKHKNKGNKERALRTPKFLTDADWFEIKEIYKEAKRLTKVTGVAHEVDHIIPLIGSLVSGLHVPTNLRIITKSDNAKKGNKFL